MRNVNFHSFCPSTLRNHNLHPSTSATSPHAYANSRAYFLIGLELEFPRSAMCFGDVLNVS